jgi:hypothetical protein
MTKVLFRSVLDWCTLFTDPTLYMCIDADRGSQLCSCVQLVISNLQHCITQGTFITMYRVQWCESCVPKFPNWKPPSAKSQEQSRHVRQWELCIYSPYLQMYISYPDWWVVPHEWEGKCPMSVNWLPQSCYSELLAIHELKDMYNTLLEFEQS